MADSFPSHPQLFNCPTCGAALDPPEDDQASLRCAYCGSSVVVPPELRRSRHAPPSAAGPGRPVVVNISGAAIDEAARTAGRSAGCSLLTTLVFLLILFAAAVGIMASTGVFSLISSAGQPEPSDPLQTGQAMVNQVQTLVPEFKASSTPPAAVLLQFGAQGSGAGQLDDARQIAIDPDGNIFVADYQDGRVQKFDPSGKFRLLINTPPDKQDYTTIEDMAADYAGKLYVARRGDILVFDTADGKLIQTIPGHFPDTWLSAVTLDPANTLYALHTSAGELDLIKMSPAGQTVWRQKQVTQGLYKKTEISRVSQLAVDGLGNIFLLDESLAKVYRFDPQGKFVDRFGSKGQAPGQLDNPRDIAIDGQGRIYVADNNGLHIFDAGGTYLKSLPRFYQGALFDLKFGLDGNLYLVTNAPQVYKIRVASTTP